MPVRPRRSRRNKIEFTATLGLALLLGPKPGDTTMTDTFLREAWELFGPHLLLSSRRDKRPWGYWEFDPDVPMRLRSGRPELHPVEDAGRRRRERARLDADRAAWLAETGGSAATNPHLEVPDE